VSLRVAPAARADALSRLGPGRGFVAGDGSVGPLGHVTITATRQLAFSGAASVLLAGLDREAVTHPVPPRRPLVCRGRSRGPCVLSSVWRKRHRGQPCRSRRSCRVGWVAGAAVAPDSRDPVVSRGRCGRLDGDGASSDLGPRRCWAPSRSPRSAPRPHGAGAVRSLTASAVRLSTSLPSVSSPRWRVPGSGLNGDLSWYLRIAADRPGVPAGGLTPSPQPRLFAAPRVGKPCVSFAPCRLQLQCPFAWYRSSYDCFKQKEISMTPFRDTLRPLLAPARPFVAAARERNAIDPDPSFFFRISPATTGHDAGCMGSSSA